jgi:hypothetical protein
MENVAIPAPRCRYCGEEFIPRSARQIQCGKPECVRRFNVERQMEYLRKQGRKSKVQQLADAARSALAALNAYRGAALEHKGGCAEIDRGKPCDCGLADAHDLGYKARAALEAAIERAKKKNTNPEKESS